MQQRAGDAGREGAGLAARLRGGHQRGRKVLWSSSLEAESVALTGRGLQGDERSGEKKRAVALEVIQQRLSP